MIKAAIILVSMTPAVSQAHAMLERAVPAVGGTVRTAPAALELDFSEGVEPRFSKFVVTGAAGEAVNAGAVHTAPGQAGHVVVPVGGLAPGTYTVTWHVVSIDTHKTQGTYRFTVAP